MESLKDEFHLTDWNYLRSFLSPYVYAVTSGRLRTSMMNALFEHQRDLSWAIYSKLPSRWRDR